VLFVSFVVQQFCTAASAELLGQLVPLVPRADNDQKGGNVIRTQLKTYHRPDDLKEALTLLQQGGKTARVIGGGIDLALHLPPDVTALIDLSRLPLSSIEASSDGITIGATATMTEVLEHPAIASYLNGVIVTTLRQVASPLLRNLATIGGTL